MQCRRPEFCSWAGKIPWRRKWQPTPVFLPGKSQGQRSLAGYSPWGHKSRTWLSDETTTTFSYAKKQKELHQNVRVGEITWSFNIHPLYFSLSSEFSYNEEKFHWACWFVFLSAHAFQHTRTFLSLSNILALCNFIHFQLYSLEIAGHNRYNLLSTVNLQLSVIQNGLLENI